MPIFSIFALGADDNLIVRGQSGRKAENRSLRSHSSVTRLEKVGSFLCVEKDGDVSRS
jgi:hypothetical protein